jgi:Cu(I)/Ag(I) efflux system membrane protein CusA/SilA
VLDPVAVEGSPGDVPGAAIGIAQVPLGVLAAIEIREGPAQIKSEQGLLTAYTYIDYTGTDAGSFIGEVKERLRSLNLPEGYRLEWGGEYQYMERTRKQLWLVIPVTVMLIIIILYLNTRSLARTAIVLLAVPFSLVGSFWLLWLLNYNLSTAVWVGLIALAGLDAETGVVMLLYLDMAHRQWRSEGRLKTETDLRDAVMHGAVKRLRPKMMTACTILAGLIPLLFSTGIGSEVMKRVAAPMVGGVITSTALELLIYPAIFLIWKKGEL